MMTALDGSAFRVTEDQSLFSINDRVLVLANERERYIYD